MCANPVSLCCTLTWGHIEYSIEFLFLELFKESLEKTSRIAITGRYCLHQSTVKGLNPDVLVDLQLKHQTQAAHGLPEF